MKQHRNERPQNGGGKKPQGRRKAPKKPSVEAVFGIHAVTSLLERQPEQVISLHLMKSREDEKLNKIVQLASQIGLRQEFMERDALDEMTGGLVHQGVVAVCKPLKTYGEQWLFDKLTEKTSPLLLVLDGVTDPHNLGAVLRTADAAGADAVIVPKDKSATLNATVRKVACGAAEVMP
ncbi:MAG: RNA methyltransferase substrate-binding domain-containing protein, partial [Oceanospirillum sp.]|nr:RNA methyltransferase substrate-binding domain-containing protein [Oceanospirillum sp.]